MKDYFYFALGVWGLFSAYEIVRLNDINNGDKWCNVSYQNRIETRPCTINNELPNVAKVEF
jgi:hypothetical protein